MSNKKNYKYNMHSERSTLVVKKIIKTFVTLIIITSAINQVNSVWIVENKWVINKKSIFTNKYADLLCKEKKIDISKKLIYKRIQNKNLSCEISATADILSYLLNRNITEDILLTKLSKSQYNKLPTTINWKKYWWNPNAGYVWYIDKLENWADARQRLMTGYWVLEKPIKKIIDSYWLKSKIINKFNYNHKFSKKQHLKLILNELEKWNMIQMWWDICTNPKFYNWKEHKCFHNWEYSWNQDRKLIWYYKDKNWKEKKYVGLNWEHAFYLLWYKWDIENPTHIIVWDTYTWKHIYTTAEWMRKWQKMQYRSIIIYKK